MSRYAYAIYNMYTYTYFVKIHILMCI